MVGWYCGFDEALWDNGSAHATPEGVGFSWLDLARQRPTRRISVETHTDRIGRNTVIENLPIGYAHLQLTVHTAGGAPDYTFLEVNTAFEHVIGLHRDAVLGRSVSEVRRQVTRLELDWFDVYESVDQKDASMWFARYSNRLERWYDVRISSDEPGHLTTTIQDVTGQQQAKEAQRATERKLGLLLEVSRAMMSEGELHRLSQIIVDGLTKLTQMRSAAFYLLNGDNLVLEATSPPLPDVFPEHLRIAPLSNHPHIHRAITTRKPVVLDDTEQVALTAAEREVCESRGLRSILYIPLVHGDECIGVMIPASIGEIHRFTHEEVNLCQTLASHAGLSFVKARLLTAQQRQIGEIERKNERLEMTESRLAKTLTAYQKSLHGIVNAMGSMLGKRDYYTADHQRRVARLAVAMAETMGLTDETVEGLRLAAEMHDVGKIAIPAEILTKPSALSALEFEIIRTHPQEGYDILRSIDFPWPIADIVQQHHERVDGSGYPKGLRGTHILPEAKVLAVADVVESIASHRPYRPALGIDVALAEIAAQRGVLYDAEAVDACLALFRDQSPPFRIG